jgi:hypothetical protein
MTRPKLRLTWPQKEVYAELKSKGHFHCVENYGPAKALIKLGLAVWQPGKFGHGRLVLPPSLGGEPS